MPDHTSPAREGGHPALVGARAWGPLHAILGFLLLLPAGFMLGISGHFDGNRVVPNPETALVMAWFGGAILAFLVALVVASAVAARRRSHLRRAAAIRAGSAGFVGALAFGGTGSLAWGLARLVAGFQVESALFLLLPVLLVGLLAPFLALGAALVAAFPGPDEGSAG